MDSLLVSVVIISWNRKKDVLETIQSIYDQAYQNLEIIVVDNGSIDGTADALRQAFPAIMVIVLDRNMGIAGRNAGIAAARGDIVFCLDSDASVGKETLTNIVSKFQAEPDLGVINSKIVNAYTKDVGYGPGWAYNHKRLADQNREFVSFSFSEGGCAIRRKVLEQVGPFWDMLFFGREGEELGLRILDSGYKILYFPEAIIYHRESPEARVDGCKRLYFDLRNSLYIYLVRYPWWMFIIFAPLRITASLYKGTRRRCLKATLRALFDVVCHLPTLLLQRKPIRASTARLYWRLQRDHGVLSWDIASWLKYKI